MSTHVYFFHSPFISLFRTVISVNLNWLNVFFSSLLLSLVYVPTFGADINRHALGKANMHIPKPQQGTLLGAFILKLTDHISD